MDEAVLHRQIGAQVMRDKLTAVLDTLGEWTAFANGAKCKFPYEIT
jgi:hypothetical protein